MRAHRGFWAYVADQGLELVSGPAALRGREEAAKDHPGATHDAELWLIHKAGKAMRNYWLNRLTAEQRADYFAANPDANFNLTRHPLGIQDSRGDRGRYPAGRAAAPAAPPAAPPPAPPAAAPSAPPFAGDPAIERALAELRERRGMLAQSAWHLSMAELANSCRRHNQDASHDVMQNIASAMEAMGAMIAHAVPAHMRGDLVNATTEARNSILAAANSRLLHDAAELEAAVVEARHTLATDTSGANPPASPASPAPSYTSSGSTLALSPSPSRLSRKARRAAAAKKGAETRKRNKAAKDAAAASAPSTPTTSSSSPSRQGRGLHSPRSLMRLMDDSDARAAAMRVIVPTSFVPLDQPSKAADRVKKRKRSAAQ